MKSWGDQFRKAFARIGHLRSLIPKTVNVIALTATATKTLSVVIERLSLHNVTIVAIHHHETISCIKYNLETAQMFMLSQMKL